MRSDCFVLSSIVNFASTVRVQPPVEGKRSTPIQMRPRAAAGSAKVLGNKRKCAAGHRPLLFADDGELIKLWLRASC